MNVLIISSANENIDDNYKLIAKKIASFLASKNYNLVFGGSTLSLMGICYNEFKNNKIYPFSINGFENSTIVKNTFDLKKKMYNKCNLIVCLPGGVGTISELLSYIEENRVSPNPKLIIVYDETNFYKNLIGQLAKIKEERFIDKIDYLKIISNFEDFQMIIKKGKGDEIGQDN